MKNVLTFIAIVAFGTPWAAAQDKDKDLHLPAGKRPSFNWRVNDSSNRPWEITSQGMVTGSGEAYESGMMLQINNNGFSTSSSYTRLSADDKEIELGPWRYNNLRVYRRIYVDVKSGYCRWIDLFENASGAKASCNVQYRSTMGGGQQVMLSSRGEAQLSEKDWALVTLENGDTSRPAVVHIFAAKDAKARPRARFNADERSVVYEMKLDLPPNGTAALCFFEAMRGSISEGKAFLDQFNPQRELDSLPPALRKAIVNFAPTGLTLAGLDMPRRGDADLAVTRQDREIPGTIATDTFAIETGFGRLELPAEKVIGLVAADAGGAYVHLALADGQVLAGKLATDPLVMKLSDGTQTTIPADKIRTLSFRISPQRPEVCRFTQPMVMLRDGQRLAFPASQADLTFVTRNGPIKLEGESLSAIAMDTPEGGLHRAMFAGGSVLSGLLSAGEFRLLLPSGATVTTRAAAIAHFVFPAAPNPKSYPARLALTNEDQLVGEILDQALTVKTRSGDVLCATDEITHIEFSGVGKVQVSLRNGNQVGGTLANDKIAVRVEGGPSLSIFAGHLVECDNRPRSDPATAPSTQPAGTSDTPASFADLSKRRAKLAAELDVARQRKDREAAEKLMAKIAAFETRLKELESLQKEATTLSKQIKFNQTSLQKMKDQIPLLQAMKSREAMERQAAALAEEIAKEQKVLDETNKRIALLHDQAMKESE